MAVKHYQLTLDDHVNLDAKKLKLRWRWVVKKVTQLLCYGPVATINKSVPKISIFSCPNQSGNQEKFQQSGIVTVNFRWTRTHPLQTNVLCNCEEEILMTLVNLRRQRNVLNYHLNRFLMKTSSFRRHTTKSRSVIAAKRCGQHPGSPQKQ